MLLFDAKKNYIVFSIILFSFLLSCSKLNPGRTDIEKTASIAAIKERGKLIAATDFSGISFFVYKGNPMGFQFEMLSDFARNIGVPLEIIPVKSIDNAYALLEEGKCDVVAMNLVPSEALSKKFSYTIPHSDVGLALVSLNSDSTSTNAFTSRSLDLTNKRIRISGKGVTVINEGGRSSDELVELVAQGDIGQAIVEISEAKVGALRFPQIMVTELPSVGAEACWAVNKRSKILLQEVNLWLGKFKSTASYGYIVSKYKGSDDVYLRYADAFISPGRNPISKYDHVMQHYGNLKGWDWKLIASIVFQESHFDTEVVSGVGAQGLMQIMPITAEHFGVEDISTPQKNIRVGVMLLNHLRDYFVSCGIDDNEAIKFVLGAYNSGLGHIQDARRLTEKYKRDPNKWEDVAFFLRMKSKPNYYRDPVVKCGKFSGIETSKFVVEVLERYGYYRSLAEVQ